MEYNNDGWNRPFVAKSHVMATIQITESNLRYRRISSAAAQRTG
jgi:hypothetical protein